MVWFVQLVEESFCSSYNTFRMEHQNLFLKLVVQLVEESFCSSYNTFRMKHQKWFLNFEKQKKILFKEPNNVLDNLNQNSFGSLDNHYEFLYRGHM